MEGDSRGFDIPPALLAEAVRTDWFKNLREGTGFFAQELPGPLRLALAVATAGRSAELANAAALAAKQAEVEAERRARGAEAERRKRAAQERRRVSALRVAEEARAIRDAEARVQAVRAARWAKTGRIATGLGVLLVLVGALVTCVLIPFAVLGVNWAIDNGFWSWLVAPWKVTPLGAVRERR